MTIILALLATVTATPATLPAVVAKARPGDRIVLAAGTYPALTIRDRVNPQPVEVDASKATVTGVTFRNSAGWTWRGGAIVGPPAQYYGVFVDNSRNVTVSDVRFSGMRVGVAVFRGSRDVEVSRNRFDGMRSDGVNIAGATNVSVVGNTCVGFRPIQPVWSNDGRKLLRDGDHPDCVQIWTVPEHPTSDLLIQGNVGHGEMQGIGHFHHGNSPRLARVRIIGNDMTVSFWHGITTSATDDLVIRDNVVKTLPGAKAKNFPFKPVRAWIRAIDNERATVCNNVVDGKRDRRC